MIVVGLILAVPSFKLQRELYKKTGKHPKGHYIGLGMAIGLALGMPLGTATGNISLGPGMGLPIGLATGIALEKKHEHELRPLTNKEEERKKKVGLFMILLFLFGVTAFVALFFLR